MASGTISLGSSGKIKGRITWSSTSNGTDANSSNVTATIQVARNDSGYTTTGHWSGALNIGGTTKDFNVHAAVSSNWVTLLSFSITKTHSADGTGTCYISGTINAPSGTSQAGNKVYDNATVTLDRIPRQANITAAPNFNDESNPTITYSNPAGSAVDSLQACISLTGAADDIAYRNIPKTETTYTFNLTTAERNVLRNSIPNDTSRTVRFYVQTVINGVTYRSYITKTFSIVNGEPTINPTILDTNSTTTALTGDANTLVRYYSNAGVTIGAAAIKGATLKSQKATNGAKSVTSNAGTMTGVESGAFVFTATDSRGLSTTKTINKSIVNYVKLTCNMGGNTPTADGKFTFTVKGNYFNGNFGAAANTLAVHYRYKESGGSYSAWAAMTVTKSGNTYTATAELTGLDYLKSYVFQAQAKDKLATVNTEEKTIKALPVFDWSADEFSFHVPVTMDNAKQLYFKATDGTDVMMISLNNSDQSFFGYGGYNQYRGSTYFDGNAVNIRSRNNINNTAEGTIGGNKAWSNSSDARLKEQITDIPPALIATWLELNPKLYKWNEINGGGGLWQLGLIAQDVIEAFTRHGLDYRKYGFISTVPVNGVDYFALTYDHYHMLTAAVLKCTISNIESMQAELDELKRHVGRG